MHLELEYQRFMRAYQDLEGKYLQLYQVVSSIYHFLCVYTI